MPYRAYVGWKARSQSFASLSAAFFEGATITNGAAAMAAATSAVGLRVTPDFFRTLGVGPTIGRTLTDADLTGPPVVVLSDALWRRQFGGVATIVGQSIRLSDVPHEIVGVMPREFDMRILDRPEGADFWTPLKTGADGYEPTGVGPVTIIGRLRDGVSIAAAQSEVAAITRDIESGYPINFNQFVVTLSSLQADNTRSVRFTLLTVSAAVASLLLIAAMNVGTLLLGRGLGRAREIAIRAAIGSGRGRLVRQLLAESLLMSILGGVGGVMLTELATRLFVAWNPLGTLPPGGVHVDIRVLAFAMAAMLVTTTICGLVPALRASIADPVQTLRGGQRGAAPAQRAQVAMLVGQLAVSLVLLVATTLLVRTFLRLQAEPLGFAASNLTVATIVLPHEPFDSAEKRNTYSRQLIERVHSLPGVHAAAAGTSMPLNSGAPVTVNTTPQDEPQSPRISAQEVSSEFFETLRIPTVAGRTFDDRDTATSAPVVMLNARAASNLFGSASRAIGQRVRLDRESWREVIGVVGNVGSSFFNTLAWRVDPIIYRPATQAFASAANNPSATSFEFHLHVRADRALTITDLRTAAATVSVRSAVTEVRRVPDLVADATRQPAFRMTLLFGFAALSLLLATIGAYGLVSQTIAHRLREIAIRLALGAQPQRVAATLIRRIIIAGIAGVSLGAVVAIALGRVLQTLLYGVGSRDTASFVIAALALLCAIVVAALIPAARVFRVDPARVLRA
jgi:predicted permease